MKDDPETERLAAKLKRMLKPRAATEPPWQATLDRIDREKVKPIHKKDILDRKRD